LKKVLFVVFVDILPFGFGSVNPLNPHIFVDPDLDPESQNLADSTDPDQVLLFIIIFYV